jgi:hypothetical protein
MAFLARDCAAQVLIVELPKVWNFALVLDPCYRNGIGSDIMAIGVAFAPSTHNGGFVINIVQELIDHGGIIFSKKEMVGPARLSRFDGSEQRVACFSHCTT